MIFLSSFYSQSLQLNATWCKRNDKLFRLQPSILVPVHWYISLVECSLFPFYRRFITIAIATNFTKKTAFGNISQASVLSPTCMTNFTSWCIKCIMSIRHISATFHVGKSIVIKLMPVFITIFWPFWFTSCVVARESFNCISVAIMQLITFFYASVAK